MTDLVTTGLAAQITAKLTALGDNAPKIAAALTAGGITGLRYSATDCPVAHYLKRQDLGDTIIVCVSENAVAIMPPGSPHIVDVEVPAPLRDFISSFDLGQYPDLATGINRTWMALIEGGVR